MRNWLARLMYGRYGNDHLGRFLSVFSMVLLVLGLILNAAAGTGTKVLAYIGSALYYVAWIALLISIFRMFSKNIEKRRNENYKYIQLSNRLKARFGRIKNRVTQSRTHRFYRCPECGATARVPKGKGKIRITCPKCAHAFIRKS